MNIKTKLRMDNGKIWKKKQCKKCLENQILTYARQKDA